jgi:hypothetical protein
MVANPFAPFLILGTGLEDATVVQIRPEWKKLKGRGDKRNKVELISFDGNLKASEL